MKQQQSDATLTVRDRLFLPTPLGWVVLAALVTAALGGALFIRYGVIQNTPIGLACEAGEESLTCKLRLAAILLFVKDVFGLTALVAAIVQSIRPNIYAFTIGLVSAACGLVLYNTRLSALAVALLVLSLARALPAKP